jgi:hypothetical protein
MVDERALRRKVISLRILRLVLCCARASFDYSSFVPAVHILRLSQSLLLTPVTQNRAMRTAI